MNKFVDYLSKEISQGMPLEKIVDAFEKMCLIPCGNDAVLFETGTFSFTGEPLFYFSLTRQYPNGEGEYFQVHLDVLYEPTRKNKKLKTTVWNEDIDGNIFDYVRNSRVFSEIKNDDYIKTDIYLDET